MKETFHTYLLLPLTFHIVNQGIVRAWVFVCICVCVLGCLCVECTINEGDSCVAIGMLGGAHKGASEKPLRVSRAK
jgi:hypothetical protein